MLNEFFILRQDLDDEDDLIVYEVKKVLMKVKISPANSGFLLQLYKNKPAVGILLPGGRKCKF